MINTNKPETDEIDLLFELRRMADRYVNPGSFRGGILEMALEVLQEKCKPIDMVLFCPNCGSQHIDAPEEDGCRNGCRYSAEVGAPPPYSCRARCYYMPYKTSMLWTNPPHRSHLCAFCKFIWRPADVPTNGAAAIKTKGEHDSFRWAVRMTPLDFATGGTVSGRTSSRTPNHELREATNYVVQSQTIARLDYAEIEKHFILSVDPANWPDHAHEALIEFYDGKFRVLSSREIPQPAPTKPSPPRQAPKRTSLLSNARAAVFAAQRAVCATVKENWPVGGAIEWRSGAPGRSRLFSGTVIAHTADGHVKVQAYRERGAFAREIKPDQIVG